MALYFKEIPNFKPVNIYAKNSLSVFAKADLTGESYTVEQNQLIGSATGRGVIDEAGKIFSIEFVSIKNSRFFYVPLAYIYAKTISGSTGATLEDSQSMLNALLANEFKLYNYGVVVFGKLIAAKQKGKNVAAIETKFMSIVKQYSERKKYLESSNQVSIQKYMGTPTEQAQYYFSIATKTPFVNFNGVAGLGAYWWVIGLIVGAAVLGFGLYSWLTPAYDASKKNYKEIKELEILLDKVDPETAALIKDKIENQIDDAYNSGKTDQFWSTFGSTFKWLAIIGGALFLVPKAVNAFSSYNQKQYNKQNQQTQTA